MKEDPNIYVVVDYFATGEGRSVYLIVTRAMPRKEDYEVQPSYDIETHKYLAGTLNKSREDIALRTMREFAGDYFGQCAEILSREDFFKRYSHMLPPLIEDFTKGDKQPANLVYKAQLHSNFS